MKVFLSSTFQDLVVYRKAAAEALERLGQQAGRMEVFGARQEEPLNESLAEVDKCDLFIGVYAHRYGFVPTGSAVSITEAEFDHAFKSHKPRFCFVVNEDHPWPPRMIEGGLGKEKLNALKERIRSGLVRDTFTTPEDLAVKVATSVGWYLSQRVLPETGMRPRVLPHLSVGTWTLRNAIDVYDWSGSTLKFQSQEETPTGLALAGSFTWRTSGVIIGTEEFNGQYIHTNRQIILEGIASSAAARRLSAPYSGLTQPEPHITTCSYSAVVSEDERSLIKGTWGSTMTHQQSIPGTWEATR